MKKTNKVKKIIQFSYLGQRVAIGWGTPTDDIEATIENSSDERIAVMLLAAAVDVLNEISSLQKSMVDSRQSDGKRDPMKIDPNPVANGYLESLKTGLMIPSGDELNNQKLSVRAKKALRRGVEKQLFARVDELSHDTLAGMRGCGSVTATEIMAWKESVSV